MTFHYSLYFLEYLIYSIILVVIIACVLFSLSYLLISKSFIDSSSTEKLASYECGFSPFSDTRTYFDVRFYIVGILFIIFDIELSLLFIWCVTIPYLGVSGFFVMWIFVVILLIGYVYELMMGALDFE